MNATEKLEAANTALAIAECGLEIARNAHYGNPVAGPESWANVAAAEGLLTLRRQQVAAALAAQVAVELR